MGDHLRCPDWHTKTIHSLHGELGEMKESEKQLEKIDDLLRDLLPPGPHAILWDIITDYGYQMQLEQAEAMLHP